MRFRFPDEIYPEEIEYMTEQLNPNDAFEKTYLEQFKEPNIKWSEIYRNGPNRFVKPKVRYELHPIYRIIYKLKKWYHKSSPDPNDKIPPGIGYW